MWWLASLVAAAALLAPPFTVSTATMHAATVSTLTVNAATVSIAAPTASPTASPAETVCTIDDPRATELSGLVATDDGYVAINDSQDDSDRIRVFFLDRDCQVTRTLGYPTPARDPEDIALAPDGTLWVADTGDNDTQRDTVALWHIPADGGAPVIHRLRYPDGPHDAEALLFDSDGTPIIVTKELAEPAGLYVPTRSVEPGTAAGVPLRRAGEFMPSPESTDPFGALAETLVTGAAVARDRSRVTLRTYLTAYEWDVPDGDVLGAITAGNPRVTQLPGEPQGEAISYTMDGESYVTISDEPGPTVMRRYARTAPSAAPATSGGPSGGPGGGPSGATSVAAGDALPGRGMPWLYAGVAGLGLILAGTGLVGITRRRRHLN